MKPPRLHSRQRGIVSVAAALILIAAVVFVLTQTYGIIGASSQSNAQQLDSTAAFFLAESGLEQGQGKLRLAPDPTVQSVCLTDVPGTSPTLGRGTFTLTTAAAGCDINNLNCTSCTITSTGKVGAAARTVVSVISLSAPSGGALGCGGSGATPVVCPVATTPAAYLNKDIVQSINVTTVPVILFSNMAYLRHPSGGANNVNAATGCVLLGPSSPACTTQWNDESNTSAGSGVVGSRGASVRIDTPGSYTFTQHLTADSLFAAVGAKFGATGSTLTISGSYWSDSGSGGLTVRNNSTAIGATNNGAACAADDGTATCPNAASPPSPIPDPPSSGSAQTSRSWCYDADTLVLGFSGKSSTNNNGDLTAFTLGTSPASSVPAGLAVTAFPKPVAGTNSELYSAMRYIYNPTYLSASDATSGAVVTGSAGAVFTGTLSNGANSMVIAPGGVTSGRLSVGDVISGSSRLGGAGNTTTITSAPLLGLDGAYTLANNSSGNVTPSLTATSTKLYVTAASRPYLAVGDTIYGTGVTNAPTIGSLDTGTGGIGSYTLSAVPLSAAPQQFASTTITSNGRAVSTPASTTAPADGTYVAERWTASRSVALASGTTLAATTVAASPPPTATLFYLTARPAKPLSGAQICGGICAFFTHTSASAQTPFTIGISGTSQWAAGMTCLKGVDTGSIVTLTGASGIVQATSWTEPVH